MRHILTIILFSFFSFTVLAANFNTTGWKMYLSYNNTNSVEESNDQVFVVAEGSLYTYGKDDNSIKQYYKGNGLNDNTISLIRYNKQTKSLLIIYDNSNIDILEGGVATNLPYLSTSTSIRNKQINSVLVHDEYAYLSTAFGIVVVNMAKKEIKDTYKLSLNITSCAIQNGNIYASTTNKAEVSSGIIYASLKENLLDKANWKPYGLSNLSDSHTILAIASFKNTLFYLVSQQGIFYENNGELSRIINSSTLKYMKVIGEKLACIDNSRVFIVSDTQKFDQINLSINDISTYQTDKYWIAEGSKGLRSIQRKGSNSFEALNEPIILDGPYSNSAFDIVCKNDKVYMIIGGKDLLNGKRFDKGGYILTYDYDKWSFIDPKEAQKKLNLPRNPRDYTSIAVTTDDSNDEIVYASSMGDGVIQYKNGTPVQSYNEKNAFKETAGGYGSGYCYIDGLAFDKNGNLNTGMSAEEFLKNLNQLFKENEFPQKEALFKLFSGKEYQTIFKKAVENQWYLEPQETGSKETVEKLYNRLQTQMNRLDEFIKQAGSGTEGLQKAVADVRGNIEFMNQINQIYNFVQLPLKMNGQNVNSELYVYTNKKNPRDMDGELSAFLHLDMDHLGSTDISVKMKGTAVKTNFYMADDASYELILAHAEELAERLENKGYQCQIEVKSEEKDMDFVEDFLKHDMPSAGKVYRYSFDVRA